MNKFVITAVSLMAVGSINSADPSDNEWLGLDNEIKSISSSLATSDNGVGMAGLLRFHYANGGDDISTGGGAADDISGFGFDDIDIAIWSSIGDYTMHVSLDLAGAAGGGTGANAELQNAFIAWKCPKDLSIQAGRMNPTFLHDGNVLPEELFFMDRTAMGSALYHYDEGLQVSGIVQDIAWFFGLFNGSTLDSSDHTYFLRGEWKMGEGDGGMEGSHEKAAGTNLTVGLGISVDNTTFGDTMNIGIDVHGNHDKIGFGFTYLMVDDDLGGATGRDAGVLNAPLNFQGDSSPMSLAVTYSVNSDWGVGIRSEMLDNDTGAGAADNDILTLGVNYYGAGHGAKWSLNYTDVGADGANPDGSYVQIGYTVGFSE